MSFPPEPYQIIPHPLRPGWVVFRKEPPYGEYWDDSVSEWVPMPPPGEAPERPRPPRIRWESQQIGLGIMRCPETHGVEEQPDRRFARMRALDDRDRYIMRRREDGLSYEQLAREVGISRERIRQLLRQMRPKWLSAARVAQMERHRNAHRSAVG